MLPSSCCRHCHTHCKGTELFTVNLVDSNLFANTALYCVIESYEKKNHTQAHIIEGRSLSRHNYDRAIPSRKGSIFKASAKLTKLCLCLPSSKSLGQVFFSGKISRLCITYSVFCSRCTYSVDRNHQSGQKILSLKKDTARTTPDFKIIFCETATCGGFSKLLGFPPLPISSMLQYVCK